MTEHPLTDGICFDIQWDPKADYQDEMDHMRAAADWQLEQVVDWLEQQALCSHQDLIPSLRAAMRPTTTQESNND